MTKFFEPIKASATHIYHSALELSPISSIVRKLYYDQCDRITRYPKVVIGTPNSWDPTTSFKVHGQSCAWSPCGQFIAARTKKTVEIRNHLTLKLLAVLQTPNITFSLTGSPAYSSDGQFLSCAVNDSVVIWDVQTGGVVKCLECYDGIRSLVWSLDGGKIAITSAHYRWGNHIEMYDISSGVRLFTDAFHTPHLWACKDSFRFVTDSSSMDFEPEDLTPEISIYEIGPTLTDIESVNPESPMIGPVAAFSPPTSRVSILGPGMLYITEIQEFNVLLKESGWFTSCQFSSDGDLFAASDSDSGHIFIWKYASGSYTLWRDFPPQYLPAPYYDLQFSPTSLSILSQHGDILQVRQLDGPPTPPQNHHPCRHAAIPPSGNYIATAHESTIKIINVHSRASPQLVDTGIKIEGLFITGNVLLAASSERVVAWLLTEEGVIDRNSIWTISTPSSLLKPGFKVEGKVGMIKTSEIRPFIYHTETGDVLDSIHEPQQSGRPFLPFSRRSDYQEYQYLCHTIPQSDVPLEDDWLISSGGMQETGWVVDPQGRHRLWVPAEWRHPWWPGNWHHDITTLSIRVGDQIVVIKF